MSGVSKPNKHGIIRVGDVDYTYAVNHAAGQIKCYYCKEWHNKSTGAPALPGSTCVGRAARFKSVVIVVRKDDMGTKKTPNDEEVQRAIKHAVSHG